MNMDYLSSDIVDILGKLLRDTDIVTLIGNDIRRPYESTAKPIKDIAPFGSDQRFYPYPFNLEYKEGNRSQIHVYFPSMTFDSNDIVEDILVWFDIVCHKSLWLIEKLGNGTYQKLIRPYEIAHHIALEMKRIEKGTRDLGVDLISLDHLAVNENYDAIRLEGRLLNWQ